MNRLAPSSRRGRAQIRTDRRKALGWAATALLAPACTAPATELHNPAGHRVFVDGRELRQPALELRQPALELRQPALDPRQPGADTATHRLPFRYYGTSRWDAQPRDLPGTPTRSERPDWQNLPASAPIAQPAPVSPWLFPFDLPLELLDLALHGRDDFTATVALPAVPEDERVVQSVQPTELDRVAARARAARAARVP